MGDIKVQCQTCKHRHHQQCGFSRGEFSRAECCPIYRRRGE